MVDPCWNLAKHEIGHPQMCMMTKLNYKVVSDHNNKGLFKPRKERQATRQ